MVSPCRAVTGPDLTMARSGAPGPAAGLWICNWPIVEGEPPILSELPVLRCEPAANRAWNCTMAVLRSVTSMRKVYDQSPISGADNVGGEMNTTFDEPVKL